MKLGVLGMDSRIARVAAAAVARGDTIALACDLPAEQAAPPLAADVRRETSWERLLDPHACDAVLVGTDHWNDGRAAAVRALVQSGRTLLLSHPLVLSMLSAYELDMIRTDSGARLIPLLPERLHPFVERLRMRIEEGLAGAAQAGPVETITFERRLPERSRAAVLAALARDVDLVRVLVGDPSRLSTLGGADCEATWAALAVGFTGPTQLPVRWQAGRGGPPGLRITVIQSNGSCTIEAPDDQDVPWSWSEATDESVAFHPAELMLDQLHGLPSPTDVPAASWPDAARAIELAETVPRSLARGRAIDLHQEEFSEIGTFRGTMASLGCGLVLATLLLLLVATLVGGVARAAGWHFGERIAAAWPQVVLAALGVFLMLQFLPLLVGANRRSREAGGPPGRPHE